MLLISVLLSDLISFDHVALAANNPVGAIGVGGLLGLLGLGVVAQFLFSNDLRGTASQPDRISPIKPETLVSPVKPEKLLQSLQPNELGQQDADVTVFAPSRVPPLHELIVQVVIHTPERETEARAKAFINDPEAKLLASIPLAIQLHKGDQLRITLECEGAKISEPVQHTTWNGRMVCVHFAMISPGLKSGATEQQTARPKVRIFVNGIPAGNVLFKMKIVPFTRRADLAPANELVQKFRKPFLSYASEDRIHVLRAAQLLGALKMEYFQGILNLSPGDRWERKLYSEIENCDVFLLFWSRYALASEWVIKEAEFALACRNRSGHHISSPEVVPILLEGPPAPIPPHTLSEFHFNDPLRHIIFAEETVSRSSDPVNIKDERVKEGPKINPRRGLTFFMFLLFYIGMMTLGLSLIWDVYANGDGGMTELGGGLFLFLAACVLCLALFIRPPVGANFKRWRNAVPTK